FFFSSRRRHTRFSRDWSSDVCSSDLLFGIWPQQQRPIQDLARHVKTIALAPEISLCISTVKPSFGAGAVSDQPSAGSTLQKMARVRGLIRLFMGAPGGPHGLAAEDRDMQPLQQRLPAA